MAELNPLVFLAGLIGVWTEDAELDLNTFLGGTSEPMSEAVLSQELTPVASSDTLAE